MVVVDKSLPTAILCSPSLICWAQYGCSHATQDTWPAYTMGMIQFSILNSLKQKKNTNKKNKKTVNCKIQNSGKVNKLQNLGKILCLSV